MAKKGRIGLDIGSTAVRAVELLGSPPTVVRASQVALPAGAVESGEVRDPGAVSDALHKLWSEGGFKGRQVYLGVGNQRVVVREIRPYLPEKELRSSLGFQVQEFIPMPVDDAVLDYHTIGEFEQDDRKMLRMLLVAAQRSMVDLVVQAVSGARLEPLGIDLVPFALVRSVGASDPGLDLEEGQVEEAIVDIGAHVTNIVVHGRGETRFVRILPSGGRDITVAIARSAGIEDDVAERLKRGQEVEDAPSPQQVRQAALQRAAAFVDEVRSSLEFYTAQAKEVQIGRVKVTGGGSRLEGLFELMRQRIPVPVEPGAVFGNVAPPAGSGRRRGRGAAPGRRDRVGPAGGGLVSRVNLLPSEIKKGQETRRRFVLFVLAGIALILLVIAFWFFQSMRLSDVQSDIDAQEQTNASLQQEINGLQKYEQLQTEAQQEQQLLDTAYANEVSFSGMLLDVSKVDPVRHLPHELRLDPGAADGRCRVDVILEHQYDDHDVRGHDVVLRGDPALRIAEHLAEPAGVGPRVGEPVDLERHRRLRGRRGLPVRHIGRPHPGRPHATRRGRSGGFGWITSARPYSRSSEPSCSRSCSWCSSCCRRWARSRRPRRTSRPP